MKATAIVLTKKVGAKILVLRNQKVIMDADLAELCRRSCQTAKPAGEAKCQPLSQGFCIRSDKGRTSKWRPALLAARFH